MANYLGAPLSRLIRERAYLTGEIGTNSNQIKEAEALLSQLTLAQEKCQSKLQDVDQLIVKLSEIDPDDIRSIRKNERIIIGEHGSFRKELIRFMKAVQ